MINMYLKNYNKIEIRHKIKLLRIHYCVDLLIEQAPIVEHVSIASPPFSIILRIFALFPLIKLIHFSVTLFETKAHNISGCITMSS